MRQHYSDDISHRYRSKAYTRTVKITGTSMIPVEDSGAAKEGKRM